MTVAPSLHSRARWLAPLLILAAGALAYSNSLHGPFIFDDNRSIVANPQVRSLNPFKSQPDIDRGISGRPLLIFTFAVDYALAGLHTEIYHVTNLLIHLVAALFLYGIVRRTLLLPNQLTPFAEPVAAIISLIWVVHPLTTQSVDFIVQRAESLAGMCVLATLYFSLRFCTGSRWWGVAAVVACACGIASKENAAVAPILVLLYNRAFIGHSFKQALARRWKFYLSLAATWLVIPYALHTGGREEMVGFHLGISPLDYARTELNVIARYIHLAFWPAPLTLDYADWPIAWRWADVTWQGWLVLAAALLWAVSLAHFPRVGFLGAWFFLILAPTSTFLPIRQEVIAEQRMYLPLIAIVVMIIVPIAFLTDHHRSLAKLSLLGAGAVVVALSCVTIARNRQFADAVTLWTDTVAKRPNNARARYDLGQVWAAISVASPPGSPEARTAQTHAEQQFQIIVNMDAAVLHDLSIQAGSLERADQPLAAEAAYTRAIAQYPGITGDLCFQRGLLRARRGDWTDAQSDYLAAIAASPNDIEARYFLALADVQLGDRPDAITQLTQIVAQDSQYKDAAARLAMLRSQK